MRRSLLALGTLLVLGLAAAGPDQDRVRYIGEWRIESSEPAPWAKTKDMIEQSEVKRLTGATVRFESDRIEGPQPIACKGPNYEIKQYPAEGLFQGALEQYGDPSTTPEAMARKLGFAKEVPSLVTGCASELEFHELDVNHLAFALNNSIYRMRRMDVPPDAPPPPPPPPPPPKPHGTP